MTLSVNYGNLTIREKKSRTSRLQRLILAYLDERNGFAEYRDILEAVAERYGATYNPREEQREQIKAEIDATDDPQWKSMLAMAVNPNLPREGIRKWFPPTFSRSMANLRRKGLIRVKRERKVCYSEDDGRPFAVLNYRWVYKVTA